jgi:hypothetical protein
MNYSVYQVNLPARPEAIIFVNVFFARDQAGFFWMWKKLLWIRTVTAQAKGCAQVKAGICSLNEVVMVSYWASETSLQEFFRGKPHRQMMQFITQHPQSLCLYNEIYSPSRGGKYINKPQGMATIYARL